MKISKKKVCKSMKICRQSIYWKQERKVIEMEKIRYKKSSDEDVLIEICEEKKIGLLMATKESLQW